MHSLLFLALSLLYLVGLIQGNQITPVSSDYTFSFTQSITPGFIVWTTPATQRIRNTNTTAPTATGSTLKISAAMEELESFQVIIAPTSSFTSMTVSMSNFSNLGSTAWIDVGAAAFSPASPWGQGSYSVTDTTKQVPSGGTVSLSSSVPTVLWITVYIPGTGTKAGTTTSTITLTPNGHAAVNIPVSLYVYNFKLGRTPHFSTYMMSEPTITVNTLAQMDAWKSVYLQHRLSPIAADWPAGFNYQVGWDCDKQALIDADSSTATDSCMYAAGCTMRRYIQGKGGEWKGQTYGDWIDNGFPIYNPIRTDNGRPQTFCNVPCNDNKNGGWTCSQAYEDKWGVYLAAVQNYMLSHNVSTNNPWAKTKGFWYTQNEPQNYNDYTISAYLCDISRKYAPHLSIMLSREAQPAIAERPEFGNCSYDIWQAHVWRFTTSYTQYRQYQFGETSWFYSLDTDGNCASPGVCGPAFQPAVSKTGSNSAEDPVATNDGPHYRVIPWVAWSNRITGWGYYHDDIFWDTSAAAPAPARPRISAALLREGLEDYEYLYIANGNAYPRVYQKEKPDDTAMSIGFAVGSWNSDPVAIHELRNQLGLKIEGSRVDFPYLSLTPSRPLGNYYIDFLDTSKGTPANTNFDGKSWMAIGWDKYDVSKGYGWNSQYIGVPNTVQPDVPLLQCTSVDDGNIIQKTICYDNYNHPDEFHFAVAQGVYNVTVAIGWPGACRGDTEFVSVNNVVFRNYTCNPCCQGVREYSAVVDVFPGASGSGIVMTFGNDAGYTVLSYMKIEATSQALPTVNPSSSVPTASSSGTTSGGITSHSDASALTCASAIVLSAVLFIVLL